MSSLKTHFDCRVHKFGGTSVADAQRFKALQSILSQEKKQVPLKKYRQIVVVSAIKKTTSTLQCLLDAAKNKQEFNSVLEELKKIHLKLVKELLKKNKKTKTQTLQIMIEKDFSEIHDILHAVKLTAQYSKSIQEYILGYGELWSAAILTELLGENANVKYLNASEVLFVYEKNGILTVDWQKSQKALLQKLASQEYQQFEILVIPGFVASTVENQRTTLGRNGSDFSGAIFARLFKAQSLTIWTDVDGIYTADPNRVPSAFVIESLSYKEAMELAYFGATVLHPMTIAPVLKAKIPVWIKNSFRPEVNGTYISAESQKSNYLIKGISCVDSVALINIEGSGLMGVSGMAARVFEVLREANISVILISQASSEHSICFAVAGSAADAALKKLNENLQVEIERQQIESITADKDCAILAIVGDGMVGAIGVSGRLFNALANANVNIRAISQGSSERNISVVVQLAQVNKAMQALHAGFYLAPKTLSIGLIGPGQVGKTLLKQIKSSLENLRSKHQVNLCLRAVMSSKKMCLSEKHLSFSHWQKKFDETTEKPNMEKFMQALLVDDSPHSVIIDCTADANISKKYVEFFEKGFHVITPNKHANAGDLNDYQKLKSVSSAHHCHYLYEATVCAGLPVITTLSDLIKTGDTMIKIEGIVSGTLSYIFSELADGKTFSEAVIAAKKAGYTEPDPREDLSGMDVARKLVCLAREVGYAVSLKEVKVHDLVPKALKSCSVDAFLEKLPAYDHVMSSMIQKAQAKQEALYYTGAIHQDGTCHVEIASFPKSHAFARLKGTDNMLVFYTARYHQQPLIIQGPGAGAEVTAAGIFADLLRLVSYLA